MSVAVPPASSSALPALELSAVRPRLGACIHKAHSVAQADLYELEWEGRPALLKDFSARPWLVRAFWSRAIAAREVRVMRRLQDLAGVPRLYATVGREGFIMERLNADRLPHRGTAPPPEHFWTRARALIEALHERGIGHGDLRRKNIMIGPEGEAYLIDFATAVCVRDGDEKKYLRNFLFRRVRQIDRVTYARIKVSYPGAVLDETERAWLASEPWFLRLGRVLKKRVYRLRKPKFWKKTVRDTSRQLQGRSRPKN